MSLLECIDISKRYVRSGQTTDALTSVSFSLDKGEILGIVGESGSGKSTLLKQISGLEKPDAGEILLNGLPLPSRRTKAQYRTIQMIFQDAPASFHPRRTVVSSIKETYKSLCGSLDGLELPALCASVGLDPALSNRLPGALSGGQCQRFAILRAISVHPEILLCDEITSALDVTSQAQIIRLLADIVRRENMSAVFVSHDLAVVSMICDRVLVMKDGRTVEEGSTAEIINGPKEPYTRKLLSSVLEI